MKRFADDPRVKVHRATSDLALGAMADGLLDWVYIDGNHNEPFIGNDLALALQKVKAKGTIAGDDYNWLADAAGAPVKRAVEAILADLGAQASLKLLANQYRITLNRS